MADVLTYVLHYQGALNKNSLGAVSEGAARAQEIGGQCHAVVVGGDDLTDELCSSLGAYGATRVFRARGREGLAQQVVDVMAEVIDVEGSYSPWSEQATMVTRGEQRGADVDIEGADILVAGGRGLGKPEGFQLVEELAAAFGGNTAVAATRAVVDAGWYPYAAQIGQTGKTVSPKLYLAAGISGAVQA